jgi:hypothetical protein
VTYGGFLWSVSVSTLQGAVGCTCLAIAQMKPASSRAIAAVICTNRDLIYRTMSVARCDTSATHRKMGTDAAVAKSGFLRWIVSLR